MQWLKALLSSAPDASFGRVVALAAFAALCMVHGLVMYSPHWLTNTNFVTQLTDKLFYLAIAGYSATKITEIVATIRGTV